MAAAEKRGPLTGSTTAVEVPGAVELKQRLAAEVNRSQRGLGLFSLILIELESESAGGGEPAGRGPRFTARTLKIVGRAISQALRSYDVCCRMAAHSLGVVLPSTDAEDCAMVSERIRERVADALPTVRVAIGQATWSHAVDGADQLLQRACDDLLCDARRQREAGTGGHSRKRTSAARPGKSDARVWLEGLPQAVRAAATPTATGMRVTVPLSFMQAGAAVQMTRPGGRASLWKVVKAAVAGGSEDSPAFLHLDIASQT